MSVLKVSRSPLISLALLLCLVSGSHAQETPETGETGRQLAAAANDDALSREERLAALRKLEEAARLLLNAGEKVEAARVLNRTGRLHLILHAPQDALNSHLKALALLEQSPAPTVEIDTLNALGAIYVHLQIKDRADEVLQKTLTLSEQNGYVTGQAQALITLSEHQNHNNHARALQTAREALGLWQTLDDKRGLARAYSQVGRCYLAQNILAEATQNYQAALAIWRDLNYPPEQAEALIMLGFIEHRKADWQSAILFLTEAQGLIDEKSEPVQMGQIATTLAEAFNENGLPENGLIQYRRALDFYRQTQDPHTITYATWGLGVTYFLLKNYTEATTHLRQALAGVDKESLQAAQCYEYLGRVYSVEGEHSRALQELQSALAIYTTAVNPREEARVRGLLGQISEQQGRLEPARQYYRQALETFTRLSDRVNQAAIYYALGRLELKRGNYSLAEDHLRQALEVTENIRRVSTSRDLTAAFSATIHDRYEKYVECLMRQHEAQPSQGFDVRAFETSELARARSLAELLRATQTNLVSGLDPKLAEKEKTLRQSLWVKENNKIALLGRAYKTEELTALEAELTALEAEYRQVTETIGMHNPAYEQITQPARWSLQQIQKQVITDDETVLLEYLLGADKSYVWAVTRDGIRSYELPAQATIGEAAQKVYKSLATPPSLDTADERPLATQQLSRMILSPVAAELHKRRLIVVADGVLNYIPFQTLPAPSSDGGLLIDNHEVVNVPSASILGELQQEAGRRRPATKVLAAFGDPVFASNYVQRRDKKGGEQLAVVQAMKAGRLYYALRDIELNGDSFEPSVIRPLFYAKRELAHLREVAAGGETFVAADFAATREQLLRTDLTQYAILHFATHGLLDPKRPENSGLVLSTVNRDGEEQDGFVTLQNIYELRAPVNLVVLSACQTAIGKDVRGEGLLSVTRGFMYAGASSVVASLWKVDDQATAELMREFYTNMLQKGLAPAAALRAAQNSIRQKPQWHSPYYWAAFTLQGEYRQVIKPASAASASSFRQAVSVATLLMLLAGVAWWYRHRRLRMGREAM